MSKQDEVTAAEDRFFTALLQSDPAALTGVLTPDFLLIDVMTGSEIPGPALVDVIGSKQLRFNSVDRIDARVRLYGAAAVVTGQTRMRGRYAEQPFETHSRYTHVYVDGPGGWRLASAQGTPIAPSPA
jgi:ketosteroid isomerase-like protein